MSSISQKLEEEKGSKNNEVTSDNADTTARTYTAEELQLRANGEIKLNEVYNEVNDIEKNNLKKKLYRKIIILSTLTVVIRFLPNILFYLFFPDVKGMDLLGGVVLLGFTSIVGSIFIIVCVIIAFFDIRFTINSLRKKYTKLALIPGVLGVCLLLIVFLPFVAPRIAVFLQHPFLAAQTVSQINSHVDQYKQFIQKVENKEFTVVNQKDEDFHILELDNGLEVYLYTGGYDGIKGIAKRRFFEKNITGEEKITLTPFTPEEYKDKISNEYLKLGTVDKPIFPVKGLSIGKQTIDHVYFDEKGVADINRYAKLLTYIKDYKFIYNSYPVNIPTRYSDMTDVYLPNTSIVGPGGFEATSDYFGTLSFEKENIIYRVDNSKKEFLFKLKTNLDRSEPNVKVDFGVDYFVGNKFDQYCDESMFCFDETSLSNFKSSDFPKYLIKRPTKEIVESLIKKINNELTIKDVISDKVVIDEGYFLMVPNTKDLNYNNTFLCFAQKYMVGKKITIDPPKSIEALVADYDQLLDSVGNLKNKYLNYKVQLMDSNYSYFPIEYFKVDGKTVPLEMVFSPSFGGNSEEEFLQNEKIYKEFISWTNWNKEWKKCPKN